MLQIHDSQGSKMRYHFRIYMIMLAWLSRWGWLYFAMINWEVGNHAHFLESPDSGDHFLCIYTVFDVFLGENHVCVYIYIFIESPHTHTHTSNILEGNCTQIHTTPFSLCFLYISRMIPRKVNQPTAQGRKNSLKQQLEKNEPFHVQHAARPKLGRWKNATFNGQWDA